MYRVVRERVCGCGQVQSLSDVGAPHPLRPCPPLRPGGLGRCEAATGTGAEQKRETTFWCVCDNTELNSQPTSKQGHTSLLTELHSIHVSLHKSIPSYTVGRYLCVLCAGVDPLIASSLGWQVSSVEVAGQEVTAVMLRGAGLKGE